MSVILDRTHLLNAFTRMVDPVLRRQEALQAAGYGPAAQTNQNTTDQKMADRDGLRRMLAGDRVTVQEHRLDGQGPARFVVIRAAHIDRTAIDLHGVCVADAAGLADLAARGLLVDDREYHLLGPARFAAAEHNSTAARRAYAAHLQSCAERGVASMAGTPVMLLPARENPGRDRSADKTMDHTAGAVPPTASAP